MAGDAETMPTHTAIGSGNTVVAHDDTALDTEVDRKAITTTSKPSAHTVRFETIWSSAEQNGNNFCEVAVLNAAAAGDIVNRVVFPAFLKQNTFELRVQTDIKTEDA